MLQYRYHGRRKKGIQGFRILADHLPGVNGFDLDRPGVRLGSGECQPGRDNQIRRDFYGTSGDPGYNNFPAEFCNFGPVHLFGSAAYSCYTAHINSNIGFSGSSENCRPENFRHNYSTNCKSGSDNNRHSEFIH